jgi:hypothetical protein
VDEQHHQQPRDPQFHCHSRHSFAEIVRIKNSKKNKKLFAQSNADPNQGGSGSDNNLDSEKIALITPTSQLPAHDNKAPQDPTKASAEVQLECFQVP